MEGDCGSSSEGNGGCSFVSGGAGSNIIDVAMIFL